MENGGVFRLAPGFGIEFFRGNASSQAYIGVGGGIADRSTILMGGAETFGYEGSLLLGWVYRKGISVIRGELGAEIDVTYNATRFSADKSNSPKMGDDYTYIKGLDQLLNVCPQPAIGLNVSIFQFKYKVGFNKNIWKTREVYSSMRSEGTEVYSFRIEDGVRHTFAVTLEI